MMLTDRLERLILSGLLSSDSYTRKVLPILQPDFFQDNSEKIVFSQIQLFITKYNNLPTKESLLIQVSQINGLKPEVFKEVSEIISHLSYEKPVNEEFLLEQTDNFAKGSAFFGALKKSVLLAEEFQQTKSPQSLGQATKYFQDALSISLDPKVGHSYTEDYHERYEYMHRKIEKVPFDLTYLNKITGGGTEKGTLNIILAGTGVGKTLAMCHLAAAAFMDGKNVLYITLEMSEEKILQRIDANLLNVAIDELDKLPEDIWQKKVEGVKNKTLGKLQVKEYPTAQAGVNHFRHLITELALKKKFVPDIIFVDYLNIAISSRIKPGTRTNSYEYVKAIAEELRGLACEAGVPLWSATQTNRAGFNSSDVGLDDTSESFGVPMTADLMIALTRTEELDKIGQMAITQLKNRYGDLAYYRRFIIGVDRSKMRLFDVEQKAQEGLIDAGHDKEDKPAFDVSRFGKGMTAEKKDFSAIKFSDD